MSAIEVVRDNTDDGTEDGVELLERWLVMLCLEGSWSDQDALQHRREQYMRYLNLSFFTLCFTLGDLLLLSTILLRLMILLRGRLGILATPYGASRRTAAGPSFVIVLVSLPPVIRCISLTYANLFVAFHSPDIRERPARCLKCRMSLSLNPDDHLPSLQLCRYRAV